MIVTFCGHAECRLTAKERERLKKTLRGILKKFPDSKFYCGGYGDFDELCAREVQELKGEYPALEVVYVTPYLPVVSGEKWKALQKFYDAIVYPPLENVPPRFAILARNRCTAERADIVIAYVSHTFGGAAKMLAYAKKKNKRIVNLYEEKKI